MHWNDAHSEAIAARIFASALERVRLDPPPLDQPRSAADLRAAVGPTITPGGIGGSEALRIWTDVLGPACISIDHPRFLSFVPCAPTEVATLFDLLVGAASVFGGTWLESSGAVHAENEALRWLADLAGLPPPAGGVFVSGGSAGNLSALVVARHRWRAADPARARTRALILTSTGAHSSLKAAANVLDADLLAAPGDERDRVDGAALRAAVDALDPADRDRIAAVVATGGTTNVGVVDDLAGAAALARELGTWFHVDCAYGGAALCVPAVRRLFDGIEQADSFVVDPHKWLFSPFDCAALLYRDPELAQQAHTQHAAYLDVLHGEAISPDERNPSDLAYHLTRRARGLPFWFSLATHGTDAYAAAVATGIDLAARTAELVRGRDHLELCLEPELSVVVFRRLGWSPADYQAWSDRLLHDQIGFVVPTSHHGETVLRFCFVHPRTTVEDVETILDTLR